MISQKYTYEDFKLLMDYIDKHTNRGFIQLRQDEIGQLTITVVNKLEEKVQIIIDIMIFDQYHGKLEKIQTRSRPKTHGSGSAGTSLSSLRLPHRKYLLQLDRSLYQIFRC